jgi:hypothetical protein
MGSKATLVGDVQIGAVRARIVAAPPAVRAELAPGAFQLWAVSPTHAPVRVGSWGWLEPVGADVFRVAFGESIERAIVAAGDDVERVRAVVAARFADVMLLEIEAMTEGDARTREALGRARNGQAAAA